MPDKNATGNQTSEHDPSKQILMQLSDLLIGISLIAKSIGRTLKLMLEEGEANEEERRTDPD